MGSAAGFTGLVNGWKTGGCGRTIFGTLEAMLSFHCMKACVETRLSGAETPSGRRVSGSVSDSGVAGCGVSRSAPTVGKRIVNGTKWVDSESREGFSAGLGGGARGFGSCANEMQ